MNTRPAWLRALHAEMLKLKHTLALHLTFIAPAVVVTLVTVQWLVQRKLPFPPDTSSAAIWAQFGSTVLGIYVFLMLPLYITLQSALLAQLEHQDRQWKHLWALPLPRSSHYLAKLWMLAALLALSLALLVLVLIPLGGWALQWRSDIRLTGGPDVASLLHRAAAVFVCSVLLLVLHTWIAQRWRSFTVAVATGMSATVMGFIVGQSRDFGPWFPWTLPLQPLSQHPAPEQVMLYSLVAAIAVTAMALWTWTRRECPE